MLRLSTPLKHAGGQGSRPMPGPVCATALWDLNATADLVAPTHSSHSGHGPCSVRAGEIFRCGTRNV